MFLLWMPFFAFAHPGKTDYEGGHTCWKNCSEWQLSRGEYHLHDKEGNTVFLDPKGNVKETKQIQGPPTPEKRFLLEDPAEQSEGTAAGPVQAGQQTIVEKNRTLTFYEESVLPFQSILLLVLAFLMLVLLVCIRNKERKND